MCKMLMTLQDVREGKNLPPDMLQGMNWHLGQVCANPDIPKLTGDAVWLHCCWEWMHKRKSRQ